MGAVAPKTNTQKWNKLSNLQTYSHHIKLINLHLLHDRGFRLGTAVGRWFDPSWCHWIFL